MKKVLFFLWLLLYPLNGYSGVPDIPLSIEDGNVENHSMEHKIPFSAEVLQNGMIQISSDNVSTFNVTILDIETNAVVYQVTVDNSNIYVSSHILPKGHYLLCISSISGHYVGDFVI